MTTNNHEVIFAIVNSGYADEAMTVARENGARCGTIINARGVAGKEAAAFFGITFHEEKEILMLVVQKDTRDAVLNALYQQMGMGKRPRASHSPCRCPMWQVWSRNRSQKSIRDFAGFFLLGNR